MFQRHLFKNALARDVTLTVATLLVAFAARVGVHGAQVRTIDDAEITRAVMAELSEETGVQYDDIQVVCMDGIVTLQGRVDRLADKRQAVALATTIRGVRAVVDRLLLPPSDLGGGHIAGRITEVLRDSTLADSWQIVVEVDEGVVTLRGQVDSYVAKMLAEQMVADVRGVREIVNDLAVEQSAVRSSDEIQQEIEKRIQGDIWLIDPDIQVTVEDGQATLTGTVESQAAKQRLHDIAWVVGVRSVEDAGVRIRSEADTTLRRHRPYVPGNDHEILLAVESALTHDSRVDAARVHVHVKSGVVILGGTVDSLRSKRAAEEDARNTLGVWDVENAILVGDVHRRSSAAVEQSLTAALARDRYLSEYDLTIAVEDDRATLKGTVRSQFDKRRAESVASSIRGVSEVQNDLMVKSAVPEPGSDLNLKYRIENRLYWSPLIDDSEITVTVHEGRVNLTGVVDSPNALEIAANIASESGASQVNNQIRIREPH
jgi:osmotically-inducible protein OsmY